MPASSLWIVGPKLFGPAFRVDGQHDWPMDRPRANSRKKQAVGHPRRFQAAVDRLPLGTPVQASFQGAHGGHVMQHFFHVVTWTETELIDGEFQRMGAGAPDASADDVHDHDLSPGKHAQDHDILSPHLVFQCLRIPAVMFIG